MDRRTRPIPEEKRLDLTFQDGLAQVRLEIYLRKSLSNLYHMVLFEYSIVQEFQSLFFSTSFHVIYYNLDVILATHV